MFCGCELAYARWRAWRQAQVRSLLIKRLTLLIGRRSLRSPVQYFPVVAGDQPWPRKEEFNAGFIAGKPTERFLDMGLETLLTSDFYSQPVNGGRHEETKSDQEADVRSNGGASSAA
jgi:hypothetical protein